MGKNIPGLSVLSAPPVSGTGPPTAPSCNGSCVSARIFPSSKPELPGAPLGRFSSRNTLSCYFGNLCRRFTFNLCLGGGLLTMAVGFLLVDLGCLRGRGIGGTTSGTVTSVVPDVRSAPTPSSLAALRCILTDL